MQNKVWRVFYEESIAYEDYVQAETDSEAKELFVNTLITDERLQPITMEVVEFEAEDVV